MLSQGKANFSVERMAAGDGCWQIRALGARRHRSPLRWTATCFYDSQAKT